MVKDDPKPRFQIRERHSSGQPRSEWQVVEGRKVIGRFDLKQQAERFVAERSKDPTIGGKTYRRHTDA